MGRIRTLFGMQKTQICFHKGDRKIDDTVLVIARAKAFASALSSFI